MCVYVCVYIYIYIYMYIHNVASTAGVKRESTSPTLAAMAAQPARHLRYTILYHTILYHTINYYSIVQSSIL